MVGSCVVRLLDDDLLRRTPDISAAVAWGSSCLGLTEAWHTRSGRVSQTDVAVGWWIARTTGKVGRPFTAR